jgi:hypothetical protein
MISWYTEIDQQVASAATAADRQAVDIWRDSNESLYLHA